MPTLKYWDVTANAYLSVPLGAPPITAIPSGPAGGDLAGAYPNPTLAPAIARGAIGYAQITANQAPISNTQIDIVGLTVTVNTLTGRRYKITVYTFAYGSGAAPTDTATAFILMDGTQIGAANSMGGNGFIAPYLNMQAIITPPAGSHTFKAQAIRQAGTNATWAGSPTSPSYILVEDIGV